ncbi:MAG TPA: DUF58 domain-containing protein, partial [Acidobacteria bacterium]|nr:DUF58 domain-containing protein [Acidobacteriota bacterium]
TFLLVGAVVSPWMAGVALAADGILLALAVLDARRARRTPLAIRRRWPPLLSQGAPAPLEIDVENRGPRPLTLRLRDGLHPALAEAPPRTILRLAGRTRTVWRLSITPRRRGEHRLLPVTVRVLGPLGLAWGQRDFAAGEVQRVFPRVRWGGRVGRILHLAQRHQMGQLPWHRHGEGAEPYALREYLPGDPVRKLHWKATARHGRPIVREDTWERGANLTILLDCGRAMAAASGAVTSKLDEAIAAALVIVRVAAARQDRVTLLAFSDRIERVVRVRGGGASVKAAYQKLYDLDARLAEPAYDLAVERMLSMERRRGVVLLLTSMADLAAVGLLREALARIRRRHRVVLANLEDPELERLAFEAPRTEEEAFAKASALEILLANRRMTRTLRAGGIRLLSTPATRFAEAALTGYLEAVAGLAPGRLPGSSPTAARHRTVAPG